jgi:hypothetical protein
MAEGAAPRRPALRKNKVPNAESSLSKPGTWRYFTKNLHDKTGKAIACLPEEVNSLKKMPPKCGPGG